MQINCTAQQTVCHRLHFHFYPFLSATKSSGWTGDKLQANVATEREGFTVWQTCYWGWCPQEHIFSTFSYTGRWMSCALKLIQLCIDTWRCVWIYMEAHSILGKKKGPVELLLHIYRNCLGKGGIRGHGCVKFHRNCEIPHGWNSCWNSTWLVVNGRVSACCEYVHVWPFC